ncbi:carbohydrate sulfotransferase 1-like isoform X2 [Varroa destructor]|uniref:Uncharacterized protein n=1 Tax=Varroa destructor TaxID=109461 RepID=A0A7M7K0F9_VARDE|nr:carbohydrate sulfotransferase 1-like isoform X2 [Varroa destructor]
MPITPVDNAEMMKLSKTVPAQHTLQRQRTAHPLVTLVSRRNSCLLGLVALCSTLIVLVQVASYSDRGAFYQSLVRYADSPPIQNLLGQQGYLLTSSSGTAQGVTAKSAQTVVATASSDINSERSPAKPVTERKLQKVSIGIASLRQLSGSASVQLSLPRLHDAGRIVGAMLKMYRVIPPNEVRRVLIVSYFRSGSTFLGDILQTPLKTFYHFEPYHITGATRLRFGDISEGECARLFGHLMRCEFDQLPEYMAWVSQNNNQFLVRHNQFLWRHCTLKNNICFNATYMQGMCQRSPLQVAKFVRVPLRYALNFVREDPEFAKSTAIVHLIRDPRAVLASRRHLDWCQDECARADALCSQMSEDVETFEELQKSHPKVTMVQIKLEELATDPFNQTRRLFQQLGLLYEMSTEAFLKTHTQHGSTDPYSTRRNSAAVAYDWQQRLSLKETLDIQHICGPLLLRAGYDKVEVKDNREEMFTEFEHSH